MNDKDLASVAMKTIEERHNMSGLQAAVDVARAIPEPPSSKTIDFLVDLREEYDRLRGVKALEDGNRPFFQCQNCGEVYHALDEFAIRFGTATSKLTHIKCHCGSLCYPGADLPEHGETIAEGRILPEGRKGSTGPIDGSEGEG